MKIGIRDQRVIKAFCEGKALDGHKLSTDGHSLDGHWMGGSRMVYWHQGKIVYPETGSRTGDQIQRAVTRCATTGRCGRSKRR